VLLLIGVVYWALSHKKQTTGAGDNVRVTSSKLVTQQGTSNPKAVITFYEDFLCPACGNFERTFGPTVSRLIDIGAIAADYRMVSILDSQKNQNYSSRAGAAALCVADESVDAFRRFHTSLYSTRIQPDERGTSFPDNAKLIELAREAGAAGKVPDCINSGKYLSRVTGEAAAEGISATPTIKINGEEYNPTTPDALVAKIKGIVGDVPGIEAAVAPPVES
jgi:protein-disulfide isomerase